MRLVFRLVETGIVHISSGNLAKDIRAQPVTEISRCGMCPPRKRKAVAAFMQTSVAQESSSAGQLALLTATGGTSLLFLQVPALQLLISAGVIRHPSSKAL